MNNSILGAVPDTDLEIKGGGGGGGGEARSPKNSFWPFRPQFGLKIRGGGGGGTPGPTPGSASEEISALFNLSCMYFTDSNYSWCIFEFLLRC